MFRNMSIYIIWNYHKKDIPQKILENVENNMKNEQNQSSKVSLNMMY